MFAELLLGLEWAQNCDPVEAGSWVLRILYHGSWILDAGSWIQGPGSIKTYKHIYKTN